MFFHVYISSSVSLSSKIWWIPTNGGDYYGKCTRLLALKQRPAHYALSFMVNLCCNAEEFCSTPSAKIKLQRISHKLWVRYCILSHRLSYRHLIWLFINIFSFLKHKSKDTYSSCGRFDVAFSNPVHTGRAKTYASLLLWFRTQFNKRSIWRILFPKIPLEKIPLMM